MENKFLGLLSAMDLAIAATLNHMFAAWGIAGNDSCDALNAKMRFKIICTMPDNCSDHCRIAGAQVCQFFEKCYSAYMDRLQPPLLWRFCHCKTDCALCILQQRGISLSRTHTRG